ncbi:hypothetical protein PSYRMG_13380 [Pseudomonas syringae UMAF0158]|nr:hypothetical protein PSYRMG_13380 [Pseudomonas syringae UMAF0158]PBP60558.1 hypothetical protein CCL18_07990 [Pseudomonas syringae]
MEDEAPWTTIELQSIVVFFEVKAMYVTRQEAYVDLSAFGTEGLHWRYVEHTMQAPWFYITLTRHSAGYPFKTMLQTMDPAVLATVICSSPNDLSVTDVMIVTPPYVNGTNSWLMEKLLEFSQCHNEENGSMDLYIVTGKCYYIPEPASDTDGLKLERCIYYNALSSSN